MEQQVSWLVLRQMSDTGIPFGHTFRMDECSVPESSGLFMALRSSEPRIGGAISSQTIRLAGLEYPAEIVIAREMPGYASP
jgi:hypothetical protein